MHRAEVRTVSFMGTVGSTRRLCGRRTNAATSYNPTAAPIHAELTDLSHTCWTRHASGALPCVNNAGALQMMHGPQYGDARARTSRQSALVGMRVSAATLLVLVVTFQHGFVAAQEPQASFSRTCCCCRAREG